MEPDTFSAVTREEQLASMASAPVDILVIGGGIVGAAVARDAAMRGLRTALVDKADFASGASGHSTRFIQGGLELVELGDWHHVRQACRERRTLLRIAPHLVRRHGLLFPIHEGSRLSMSRLALTLGTYQLVGAFTGQTGARFYTRRGVLRREPGIREAKLSGGAYYVEGICDDARLTLATVRSAHQHGAFVANYAEAIDVDRAGGSVRGARVTDLVNGGTQFVQAGVIVLAAGAWSDALRARNGEAPMLRLTKGVHIVVPKQRLGNDQSISFLSPIDGRIVYVVSWDHLSYIGTTETEDVRSPEHSRATADDVVYLLRSVNALFPSARLGPDDVISTWAGVRSLIRHPDVEHANDLPRRHRVSVGPNGLIAVAGGRLTTHRAMAHDVMEVVAEQLRGRDGRRIPTRAPTATEPLPGGEVRDLEVLISEWVREGFTRQTAEHLVYHYGTETPAVARLAQTEPALAKPVVEGHPTVRAQLVHALRREMAVTLIDLLARRTHVFHEVVGHGVPEAPGLVDLAANELGWDSNRKAAELAAYLQEIQGAMAFRDTQAQRREEANAQRLARLTS
jgi:glycerol-3-phosphate dehydrogenase